MHEPPTLKRRVQAEAERAGLAGLEASALSDVRDAAQTMLGVLAVSRGGAERAEKRYGTGRLPLEPTAIRARIP